MKITIGISSGIAAYKVLDLINVLKKKGHEVQVILTASASHMISVSDIESATNNKVFTTLFEKDFDYKKVLLEKKIDHIELAKNSDLFIIAPATANLVSKLAQGITDDFLTTTVLATTSPVLVCPSMNTNMWFHKATQENCKKLMSYGYYIMDPESGDLACGTVGAGRLPQIDTIATEAERILALKQSLKGKKIMVTTGGTVEEIDSARVVTNKSTGKMGIAIAEECYRRGAEVLLVRSVSSVQTYLPINQISFTSASDLESILKKEIPHYEGIIHAAAVSDFTVEKIEDKIDSAKPINLKLIPTKKIINEIKKWNPKITLIGFKGVHGINEEKIKKETEEKFKQTKADFIIVNDISRNDVGFGADENEVYIVSAKGKVTKIHKESKKKIAEEIIKFCKF